MGLLVLSIIIKGFSFMDVKGLFGLSLLLLELVEDPLAEGEGEEMN